MIYILRIKFASGDYIKIGRASNLESRLNQYMIPVEELDVEYIEETNDDARVEYELKNLLDNNVRPEWFKSSEKNEDVLNEIKTKGLCKTISDKSNTFRGVRIDDIFSISKDDTKGNRGAWLTMNNGDVIRVNGGVKSINSLLQTHFKRTSKNIFTKL